MRALCRACGEYHEVLREFEDGRGDRYREIFELAPEGECSVAWIETSDLRDAELRHGRPAFLEED